MTHTMKVRMRSNVTKRQNVLLAGDITPAEVVVEFKDVVMLPYDVLARRWAVICANSLRVINNSSDPWEICKINRLYDK